MVRKSSKTFLYKDFFFKFVNKIIGITCDFYLLFHIGDDLVKTIKEYMDEKWDPHWHVFIGRNFGSMVTHETKTFLYFYFNDKAVMMFKAGQMTDASVCDERLLQYMHNIEFQTRINTNPLKKMK